MEFRLLGQLEVLRGGEPVDLGPRRQRSLLALLLLHRGQVLPSDRILEALWGDDGATKQQVLWVHVSNLRSALEPDRPKRSDGSFVRTRAPGYVFETDGHHVDVDRFEELVAAGSARLADEPEMAASQLAEALTLWRGTPCEEFVYEPFVHDEVSRLEEIRLEALEHRIEADLALGRASEVVAELETLVREHPIRESFTALLMRALFATGRQAEALRRYQHYRIQLVEDVGLEPSPHLRRLEERILVGDQSLHGRSGGGGGHVRSYEIGERLGEGSFSIVHRGRQPSVGREVAIKVIRAELANDPDFVRRFEAEAQMVAKLEHPHIVPLYDFWREPGAAFLVMRLLRGGTLNSRLADAALSIEETSVMVEQVGDALALAHDRGVVHRDVKPANVFLDEHGQFYLGDFGIAVDTGAGPDPVAAISLGSPAYASPEQLSRRSVGPEADVFGFAVTVYEALAGRLPFEDTRSQAELTERQINDPFPPLSDLVPGLPRAVDSVIERATTKDPVGRTREVAQFARDFLDAVAEPAVALRRERPAIGRSTLIDGKPVCPYVGLAAFGEADADRFHGRNRLITQLIDRLVATRMLTVVGPSGSGKSSLVKAGLIPAVRAGAAPRSDQWFVATMTPGRDPYEELEATLLRVAVNPPASLREQLMSDDRGLARAIRRVLPEEGGELLLVIDQFEELFTLCDDADARRSFLRGLVAAATDDRSGLRVVATCRADFYDRPLRHPELAQLMRDGSVPITPLAPDELERAIVDPAARAGVEFEPGLVSAIVAAVNDQPGALPLLQFTLTRLWDSQVDGFLTMAAYRELGGVSGALSAEAEAQYQALDPGARHACRLVFRRLVTPGEGAGDTRRRADRVELETISHGRTVIDAFGEARLLAFDRDRDTRHPTVEVAHEALLREWPRLSRWIDEDRDGLRIHRQLAQAAAAWETSGRDVSELYRGGRLEVAAEYAAVGELAPIEQEFVSAGMSERDRVALAERQRVRRLRALLIAVAAVAVIALGAGAVALVQQRRADSEARDADAARAAGEVRRMAADAPQLAQTDARLGLLLAAEAYRRDPGPSTLGALQRVFLEVGSVLGFLGAGTDYSQALWTPDGDRLVGVTTNAVDIYDVATLERLSSIDVPQAGLAALGPADLLAVVADSRQVLVVRQSDGVELQRIVADARVTALEIIEDGTALAIGTERGTLDVHDLDSGAQRWSTEAHTETTAELRESGEIGPPDAHEPLGFELGVRDIDHTADGGRLLTTGGIYVRSWDAETGAPLGEVVVVADDDPVTVSDLHVLPDARVVVRASRVVQVRDLDSGEAVSHRVVLSNTAAAVADAGTVAAHFTDELAYVAELDQVAVISLDSGALVTTINLQSKSPTANVVVSADGRHLAAAGPDGLVVHALDGRGVISTSGPNPSGAAGLSPSDDGRYLGLGDNDSSADVGWTVWDLDADEPRLTGADPEAGRVFLEVPGMAIVQDDAARLSSISIEDLVQGRPFPAPFLTLNNYSQAYDPNQNLLVFGTGEPDAALVHVLDAETLEEVAPPLTNLADDRALSVVSASFNPDGSRLAASSFEGIGYVFDTTTWEPIARLGSGGGAVVAVEYSHDGRFLATSGTLGEITIRDAVTNQPVGLKLVGSVGGRRFAGEQPLAFSDDGRFLVSSIDGSGRIWDLETRTQVGSAFEPDFGTISVPAKNGTSLSTTTSDGRFVVYDLAVDGWFDVACRAAGRNLTADEWEQFGPDGADHHATCPQWPLITEST